MPTGTGKTTLFSSLVAGWHDEGKRVLLVVHRIELVDQIVERLAQFGVQAGVFASGYPLNLESKVQVGMIQGITSNLSWIPDYVVIDECHHSTADSYTQLWNHFPEVKILGVTATPVRMDGQGFSDLYQRLLNLYKLEYFFQNDHLVRPLHFFCSSINPKYLKEVNGDYSISEQSKFLIQTNSINNVVQVYQRYSPNKKGIVFAANVRHSKMLVERFNALGIPAAHICGKVPKDERKEIVNKFKKGIYTILCNYDIVSEGFDVPDIDTVLLARRTKSLSTYIQMVGRCLRPDVKNGKKNGYVLDCSGQWLEFGLAGLDFPWELDMKKDIILSAMETQKLFIKGKNGKLKSIYEDPTELEGMNLVAADQELQRTSKYESFLYEINPDDKLISALDAEEAFHTYADWMELVGYKWTPFELKYIEMRMRMFGAYIPTENKNRILTQAL
jgi:superfamily II DNA or RNA helicase